MCHSFSTWGHFGVGSRACLSFGHEEAQNFERASIKHTHLVNIFRKEEEKPKRRLFGIQNQDHEKWITSNLFCNPRSEVDPEYLMRFQALEDFRGFVRLTSLWLLIAEHVIMCLQNYFYLHPRKKGPNSSVDKKTKLAMNTKIQQSVRILYFA